MARSVQQNDVQFPLSDSFPNIFTFESDIQATENEPSVFSSYYYYNAGNPDIELLLGNEPNQPQNLSNIFLDASKSESKSEEEVMKLSYSYNSQESATPISSQTTTGPPSSSSSTNLTNSVTPLNQTTVSSNSQNEVDTSDSQSQYYYNSTNPSQAQDSENQTSSQLISETDQSFKKEEENIHQQSSETCEQNNNKNNNSILSSSSSSSSISSQYTKSWTTDYLSIYNELYRTKITPGLSQAGPEVTDLNYMQHLIDIAEEFSKVAQRIGQKIVEEKFKPPSQRTIPPASAGGIAGGTKYIYEGIFFKFATDDHRLYGGNLEYAGKAAGHEMKGLQALLEWELKTVGLYTIKFPLTTLIDYRGFRLVATTILPLSSKTIVYGSPDGGKTYFTGTERPAAQMLVTLLEYWSRYLNLKPHEMRCKDKNVKLYTAFDLEGHIGTDGNYYCCDFARVFPPTAPNPKIPGSFLFRLFRPEFCRKYEKPLCSDGFMKHQVNGDIHNKELCEATHYLIYKLIPETAVVFEKIPCCLTNRELLILIHQRGVNFRYLRLLSAAIQRKDLLKVLLTEIVARTCKHLINGLFRAIQIDSQEAYFEKLCTFLNTLIGNDEESKNFWESQLQREICIRFDFPSHEFLKAAQKFQTESPSWLEKIQRKRQTTQRKSKSFNPNTPSKRSLNTTRTRSVTPKKTQKSRSFRLRSQQVPVHDSSYHADESDVDVDTPKKRKELNTPKRNNSRYSLRSSIKQVKQNSEYYDFSQLEEYSEPETNKDDPDFVPDSKDNDQDNKITTDENVGEVKSVEKKDQTKSFLSEVSVNITIKESDLTPNLQGVPMPGMNQQDSLTQSVSLQIQQSTTPQNQTNSNLLQISLNPLDNSKTPFKTSEETQLTPFKPNIEKRDIDFVILFNRLENLLNIRFKPIVYEKMSQILKESGISSSRIVPDDIESYTPKVKHTFLTVFQHAFNEKRQADQAEDFDERHERLERAKEKYLHCLELCSLNDFALHNLGRVLEAVVPFCMNDLEKQKRYWFLHEWMSSLAFQLNEDLKKFKADIYRYSDLYDVSTGQAKTKIKASEWWPALNSDLIKRFLLMHEELRTATYDQELIADYYYNLFDELKDSLKTKTIERKAALSAWKILWKYSPKRDLNAFNILIQDTSSWSVLTEEDWKNAWSKLQTSMFISSNQ